MRLEHLVRRNFEQYLSGIKERVTREFYSTFNIDLSDVKLSDNSTRFKRYIQEMQVLQRQNRKKYILEKADLYLSLVLGGLRTRRQYQYNDLHNTIYFPMDLASRITFLAKEDPCLTSSMIHELGHALSTKINPLLSTNASSMYYYHNNPYGDVDVKRKFVILAIDEGFSCFLQYDLFCCLYSKTELGIMRGVASRRLRRAQNADAHHFTIEDFFAYKYVFGYNFFHTITTERGPREAIRAVQLAKKLIPEDILCPQEYMQRFDPI